MNIWAEPSTAEGTVTLFAVNSSLEEPLLIDADARDLAGLRVIEHLALDGPDLQAANTQAQPEAIIPRTISGSRLDGCHLTAVLPPASWNVIRLEK